MPAKKAAAKTSVRKITAPVLRTLTPTCAVKGARDALALNERLFGAKVLMSLEGPTARSRTRKLASGTWTEPVTMAVALRVDDAQSVWNRAIAAAEPRSSPRNAVLRRPGGPRSIRSATSGPTSTPPRRSRPRSRCAASTR